MDSLRASPRGARRVLHLVSTFQIKTDTKWLLQLARHFDRRRWHISIACFYAGGSMQERFEALGVRTFNLDSPGQGDPRAILRAKQLIDGVRPDIVHTHLLRADLFGAVAARWAGAPLILSTVYGIGRFRRDKKRRSDRLLDLASAALPNHTLAVCDAVKRDCVERLGTNPADITVIRTGIDPPQHIDSHQAVAFRHQWRIGNDHSLVLTPARLSREKGIDTLIDAAAIVHRACPEARFVVLGEGPDRPSLEARIDSLGLQGVVSLAGFCEDIWPALAAADIVCLPSKSEGLPNALLEAMSIAKPIVATAIGGVPELVESQRNGLMVQSNDSNLLAAALLRLIGDPNYAARLGEAAHQTIQNGFLVSDVAGKYAQLYESLSINKEHPRALAHA